ncbi:MAG: NADPH-dependent glutamate synthase [Muribaculaceae bacterium]|nr:NADPH-dependent glutamate synthase [Muribaculaceae bacterium]
MEKIDRIPMPEQAPEERIKNFKEVTLGYSLEQARLEASRCLDCKKPRCVPRCPVEIDIPGFIRLLREGDVDEAYRVIALSSSLPSVCGRVCPQENQCEGGCILGIKGESVAIGNLERFVGDHASAQADIPERKPDAKKVAIVGAGPAGLACAADLAKLGYAVTVFEALHKEGGVLVYGIPEFRLPKEGVVAREVDAVRRLGVEFCLDEVVGRTVTVDELLDSRGFSAVFLGTGAGLPRFMNIPGENLNGVFSANEFLTRANLMHAYSDRYATPIYAGRKCVVVGGGNVAMDAVRTARRLGADASIVYRRSEQELPARAEEVRHAREEGIGFMMLTNPVRVIGNDKGEVTGIECISMELGEPDESGRRSPVPVEGSNFIVNCDTVIMALGTTPNPLIKQTTDGLDTDRRGCITASPEGATSRPGVFAGGDAVTGAATVILAMGAGRKAAAAIAGYIGGA